VVLVVTLVAITQGQRQDERRRVRVRGRERPSNSRAIDRPIPQQQPPVSELSCPEPEGLQVYPDPTSCNRFYKVLLNWPW
jgi:hypothetical protein